MKANPRGRGMEESVDGFEGLKRSYVVFAWIQSKKEEGLERPDESSARHGKFDDQLSQAKVLRGGQRLVSDVRRHPEVKHRTGRRFDRFVAQNKAGRS